MRILGIDPGSHIAGFGVIDWKPQGPIHVEHGSFNFSKIKTMAQKLERFHHDLQTLVDSVQPQVISVEKIFLGKNADSAFKLGHMRAIALLIAAQNKCEVSEFAARTVKKVVTGHGGAEKEHVKHIVMQTLGLNSILVVDASDALALAMCHGYRSTLDLQMKDFDL